MANEITTQPPAAVPQPAIVPAFKQVISGVTPPQSGEARIREEWPTFLGISPGLAALSRRLVQSVVLLPLALPILGLLFAAKIGPFCRRYTLTNRRLAIRRGWKPRVLQEVALADIDEVRLDEASVDPFFVSGTLEVVSKGQVVMRLPGTPEPEGFRQAIVNAFAWVPGKSTGPFQAASAVK